MPLNETLCALRTAALVAASAAASSPVPAASSLGSRADAEEDLALRWVAPPPLVAGQTFDLVLEIELARPPEEAGLLQLFPQPLDLPIQVEAFAGIVGITVEDAVPASGSSLVVDGAVTSGEGPLGGMRGGDASGQRWRLVRRARADRAGRFELPAPSARYATATEFRDDLVRGRVPLDREDRSARGETVPFQVRAIPEEGRPLDFEGAVGAYELSASLDRNVVRVGEAFELKVVVEGSSALDATPAPRVDGGEAFDVQGARKLTGNGPLAYAFALVPRTTRVERSPIASLTAFDPTGSPAAFVTVESEALPLLVQAAAPAGTAGTSSSEGPAGDTGAPEPSNDSEDAPRPRLFWTPLTLGAVFLLAVASSLRRRRHTPGGSE